MAKGIPLMGRGPDGKAKMINVDENGNVKVLQSGTNVVETVFARGVYNSLQAVSLVPPNDTYKGVSLYFRVYGLTGTNPTVLLRAINQLYEGDVSVGFILETDKLSSPARTGLLMYPGVAVDNVTTGGFNFNIKAGSIPYVSGLRISLDFTGSYSDGEGADLVCYATWLP